MDIQNKIMRARYGLQFQELETAKLGLAAARYALKPGAVDTVQVSGADMLYNETWVKKAKVETIAQTIIEIVRENITPEEQARIDDLFAGRVSS